MLRNVAVRRATKDFHARNARSDTSKSTTTRRRTRKLRSACRATATDIQTPATSTAALVVNAFTTPLARGEILKFETVIKTVINYFKFPISVKDVKHAKSASTVTL